MRRCRQCADERHADRVNSSFHRALLSFRVDLRSADEEPGRMVDSCWGDRKNQLKRCGFQLFAALWAKRHPALREDRRRNSYSSDYYRCRERAAAFGHALHRAAHLATAVVSEWKRRDWRERE